MDEILVISTSSVPYDDLRRDLEDIPEIEIRIKRSATGSEQVLLAFRYTKDIFHRVLQPLARAIGNKGSIVMETETVERGKKVKKKLEVRGGQLTGAVDVSALWDKLNQS